MSHGHGLCVKREQQQRMHSVTDDDDDDGDGDGHVECAEVLFVYDSTRATQ